MPAGWREIRRRRHEGAGPARPRFARGSPQEILTYPWGSKPLAFQPQERQFIHRIEQTQIAVEFQTIDDPRLPIQKDVLGPEVAMPFDNPPLRRPFLQQTSMVRQERGLSVRRPARLVRQIGRGRAG